jgi:hypothetical protein
VPTIRTLVVVVLFTTTAIAQEAPLPKPADVKSLAIHPAKVELPGDDASAQLVVTATLTDGRVLDLTHDVKYTPNNDAVNVSVTGRVSPQANGLAAIAVSFGDQATTVPVIVSHMGESRPINFPNRVVPVFTKLGCNSGGCHGKQSGQNGFRLSLLGFDPELDYATLVKETRGRRLFPASPDDSLLLLKGTGVVPHGGGKKLEPTSDEYKVIRRWIAAGMPYGNEKDPTVAKITVVPNARVLPRQVKQQVAVFAHYTDGTVEDVTRRAQFESNDQEVATVDGNGLVRTLGLSGQAAVMARYQGQVAVFRATVPLGVKTPDWSFEPKTVVDTHTSKKWRELGLMPSELSTDEVFARRIYLDLTGTLPTPKQVAEFVTNTAADKREKLIDQLLDSPEYADYFANKWADILRVKRRGEQQRAAGTFAFHAWIRQAIASDMPYSEFVRSILGATGDETKNPPTVWYKELEKPEQFVDDVAQVFLGQRLACAQCHHHPYEKWSQDDYWGLAAFFGRVGRKDIQTPSVNPNQGDMRRQVVFTRSTGGVTNKRTNKPAVMKPLDGAPVEVAAEDDPRHKLADWMTDPKNPFFAQAVANRYWAHFFSRGIVDPPDDMRVTNPPSNPELLDALAKHLTDHKFSLKALVRVIVTSRTYQLSAVPNEFNKGDKQSFARYHPKRLQAEVLLDAVNQVTDSPMQFGGAPKDRNGLRRALQLPDESFNSYFLDVFGRPQRISACECERVSEANLAQALHLLNSDEIQNKVTNGNGRVAQLTRPEDKRSDAEKVEEMFLWAFSRKPTEQDLKVALDHIQKHEKAKKTAYENILWAILNTKEFQFVQ